MRELAASLGLGPYTYFLGRCQKVAELLALSEVCAFSSSHEGFSNSILEYMAAAKPVVVTEAGGAREAVIEGETGYVVRLDDHQEMAARIITILNDPERGRAMGRLGEQIVREKFSCETQIQLTHKLYEQLLTRDTAAGANSQRSAGKIGWGVRK
jgi:glycosyltransferase involved in cell wall biosynthesis